MEIGLYLHPSFDGDWRVVSGDSAMHRLRKLFHLLESLIRKMPLCFKALCNIHESLKSHSLTLEEQRMFLEEWDYFCLDILIISYLIFKAIGKCRSFIYFLPYRTARKEFLEAVENLTITF